MQDAREGCLGWGILEHILLNKEEGGIKKGKSENVGERESNNFYPSNLSFSEQSSREGSLIPVVQR